MPVVPGVADAPPGDRWCPVCNSRSTYPCVSPPLGWKCAYTDCDGVLEVYEGQDQDDHLTDALAMIEEMDL